MGRALGVLFIAWSLTGCFTFSDLDEGTESTTDSDSQTGATDTDTDSDVDTDIDADTDVDADGDIDMDGDIDSDTDMNNDVDGDSDTESVTNTEHPTDLDGGDADEDASLDGGSDMDASTDTAPPDSDTHTESVTHSGTETDTCPENPSCETLGWDCSDGETLCGVTIEACPCPDAHKCNVDHKCDPCNTSDHCGPECDSCDAKFPDCQPQDQPAAASCFCTTDPDSCGPGYRCSDDRTVCLPCNEDTACGLSCTNCKADESASTPFCDTTGGTCVECAEDSHCTGGTEAPFNSAIGICTPDHACSCWVESLKGGCTLTTQCPQGYHCARDWDGPGVADHYACLRSCTAERAPELGITCEYRRTAEGQDQLVWVPMTTCFAYRQFKWGLEHNLGCTELETADCSIDGVSGTIEDGNCLDGWCTYPCYDSSITDGADSWCANNSCNVQYCVTPNNPL